MDKYPKIQSIYKRDEKTHKFIEGKFSRSAFEYLQNNIWIFSEKIDGTNVRIIWEKGKLDFRQRTDKAKIPVFIKERLEEMFSEDLFQKLYPDMQMTLYGEGFGNRIRKGGKYIPDGISFILFDILIDGYWLKRESLEDISGKLGIPIVPIVGQGTLHDAIKMVCSGFKSTFGNFIAEGLVLKPKVDLLMQNKRRVITKVKHEDFK